MKKISLRLLFIFCVCLTCVNVAYSQDMKLCFFYDGYWGDWNEHSYIKIQGSYNGFIMYHKYSHPSDYFFKFEINHREPPTKKEVKEHEKYKTWWVYSGYVEYYVCDVYPTYKDCVKNFRRFLRKTDLEDEFYQRDLSIIRASCLSKGQSFTPMGYKKVRSNATIKIAPYSHKTMRPMCYNIYFDGFALGIDMYMTYFKDTY